MRVRAAVISLALITAACREPEHSWFRHPEAPATRTIFSPLDLPPPSTQRTGSGAPGPAYWQQQVDYSIDATLDPPTRGIAAKAHVTYHNNSPDTLSYLWLHLEQNSFRDNGLASVMAPRAPDGTRRGGSAGYTIKSVRGADGADLTFTEMDLVGRLDLPAPLPPGATCAYDMEWSFSIPEEEFRRFGIKQDEQGTSYDLAQWIPCVAVYDDVYGWNTLPYVGEGEFYTNFGDFDVRLTVPRADLVVATGVLQNPQEVWTAEQQKRWVSARHSKDTVAIRSADEVGKPDTRPAGDGPLSWHFKADKVRTFAWAAGDQFIVDAAALDGTPDSTLCISAYPKEALDTWKDSTQMLRAAMGGFNQRWSRFPYPVMTSVAGAVAEGMEYPMIIFCGEDASEPELYHEESHEVGHQWFPMTVNTDERRHAWMDEGFNTFINCYIQSAWPGKIDWNWVMRSRVLDATAKTMRGPDQFPIDTPPDRLTHDLNEALQYDKAACGLILLRESILGPERFDFAFRTYISRWAFKSPQPADFYRCMEDAAGEDLAWFWRGWFQETAALDQAVGDVVQPTVMRHSDTGESTWEPARLVLENRGDLVMPIVVQVTFEGGEQRTIKLPVDIWSTTNRWTEPLAGSARITSVVIDPHTDFPDVDRANNAWLSHR